MFMLRNMKKLVNGMEIRTNGRLLVARLAFLRKSGEVIVGCARDTRAIAGG